MLLLAAAAVPGIIWPVGLPALLAAAACGSAGSGSPASVSQNSISTDSSTSPGAADSSEPAPRSTQQQGQTTALRKT
jgi:hypothetical protein